MHAALTRGRHRRPGRSRFLRVALAACCGLAATGLGALSAAPAALAAAPTISADTLRTGWDSNEPGLSPSAVGASDFGQLFTAKLDGAIYGQPVVGNGTLVVTTEHASAYGIDPETGKILWTRHFGLPFPATAINCGDLKPYSGSTSTPVIDTATGTVYLTTKTIWKKAPRKPMWFMHALSVATGQERPGWPVKIAGKPDNDSTAFNAYTEQQRPGLLLMGGTVYAAFGAHCDIQPYRGYVVGVSTTSHSITAMWADESGNGSKGAGIWQSGGGLVSDGPGRIILSTGNGLSPAPGPGSPTPRALAESVVRLQVGPDGKLAATDFFSPHDAPQLDHGDRDLGAGGPMAIPAAYGTAAHPHLVVQIGKDGRVYLLDADNLGGRKQGPGGTDAVLGLTGPYKGVWGHPAFYGGDNGAGAYVYDVENNGPLRAHRLGVSADGTPQLSSAGTSSMTFGYTSGSPVVTSTGTAPGSALVWVIASKGPTGAGGQLLAFDAIPVGGVLHLRYSAPLGSVTRFPVPATDDGKVYVGTLDGRVLAFGRPARSALQTAPLDLGGAAVGSSVSGTETVTATRALTITGVTTAAPFGVTPPQLPVELAAGDSVDLPVSFSPTAAGHVTGTLTVTTDQGSFAADLLGRGTAAGLAADPATLDFGQVQSGGGLAPVDAVSITNTGTSDARITAVVAPGGPFSADQLPAVGDVIAPAASIAVPITYTPQPGGGASASTLEIDSDQGNVIVPITGTSVSGAPALTLAPATLDFGAVPVNVAITLTFTVVNTGNLPLTITKAKAPAGAFTSPSPLPEGISIPAGDSAQVPVTFRPHWKGHFSTTYEITGDDGSGAHEVTLTGVGAKRGTLPYPSWKSWTFTGGASVGKGGMQLTGTAKGQTAGAFEKAPAHPFGMKAVFQVFLGGGSGGEGTAFVMADASRTTPATLGAGGAGLGYAGLPGLAVVFDTQRQDGEPAMPVVGLVTGGTGSGLHYVASSSTPQLRGRWHKVVVTVTRAPSKEPYAAATVTVIMDGRKRFAAAVPAAMLPLPDEVYLGFTATTSDATDRHLVRGVHLTALKP